MSERHSSDESTVVTERPAPSRFPHLSLGARIGLTIAVLVLVFAIYHLFLPVDIATKGGAQFRCGTVVDPPTGTFQQGTCGGLIDRQRIIAVFSAIAAVVVAAGSLYAFGTSRRRRD